MADSFTNMPTAVVIQEALACLSWINEDRKAKALQMVRDRPLYALDDIFRQIRGKHPRLPTAKEISREWNRPWYAAGSRHYYQELVAQRLLKLAMSSNSDWDINVTATDWSTITERNSCLST